MFQKGFKKQEIEEVLMFIDWVIQLPKDLEIKFDEELTHLKGENIMSYVTTWERKGIEKGEKLGIEKGEKLNTTKIVKNLHKMGMSNEQIAKAVLISEDEVSEYLL
jgi:predicted transposase/invertase (TIGR01784 family)